MGKFKNGNMNLESIIIYKEKEAVFKRAMFKGENEYIHAIGLHFEVENTDEGKINYVHWDYGRYFDTEKEAMDSFYK